MDYLRLHPSGKLVLETRILESSDFCLSRPALTRAARKGTGPFLFELGANFPNEPLPPGLAFFRDLARRFFSRLCSTSDGDEVVPAPGELEEHLLEAPPMPGGEYLRLSVLEDLWKELHRELVAARSKFQGKTATFLQKRAPSWHQIGRIHLHLAEKKDDEANPFAFLATYTEGMNSQGKPRHLPLGRALESYGKAGDRKGLKALLEPVHRAAEESTLVAELLASGDLFHPLAWTPPQAYCFLRELPVLEKSGVVVRVPDWWKSRPRPRVRIKVGQDAPSRLGLEALLDFSAELTLEGVPLSRREQKQLLEGSRGLVLLKGRWVEADPSRIQSLLQQWKKLGETSRSGLSFAESMRLLAGANLGGEGPKLLEEDGEDWTERVAGDWLEQALAQLRGQGEAVEKTLTGILTASLRPYQIHGVRWLHALAGLGLGACLADDMGLGKTLQVLASLLLRRQQRRGPHLLVLPASLLANWAQEIQKFAPSLDVLVAHPSFTPRKELEKLTVARVEGREAVLTSYGYVSRLKWAQKITWDTIVLDEAQAIKNPGTGITRTVKKLSGGRRVALTGTPVENRLGDLWSLFDFLNPGLLGTAAAFARFTKAQANTHDHRFGSLRSLLKPYILRRLKRDPEVAPDLPDKTELDAYCGLSPRQAALYVESVQALTTILREKQGIERRGVVLAFMLRFQQICNHPSQWLGADEFPPEDSAKLLRLGEIAEVISSRQEKMLVFTRFRGLTAPLADFLAGIFGRPGLVLHGGTPVRQRGNLVKSFQQEEGPPFFVLSLKAGGTGLNLTAASHVVHFDRWWNPAVEAQATDRVYRIGQTRNVLVHRLICRGTIEERIDALLKDKQALAQELLGNQEEGVGKVLTELDDEELLALVRLDLETAGEGSKKTGGRK